jgi:hypothetical protein
MQLLAYLDPGSGSMLLQVLLGGAAGAAVAIKMFGKRMWRFLAFWKRGQDESRQDAPEAPATERTRSSPSAKPQKESV